VITKVTLSVNVGDSVALKVMLMHCWTVRYSICGVVREKVFLMVWIVQCMA